MTSPNFPFYTATAALLASLNLVALPLAPVSAQKISGDRGEIASAIDKLKGGKVVYTPPKDVGTPTNTVGGLSRGECKEVRCLMALMPNTKSGVDHFPQTVSSHPVFFFNAPKFSGWAEFRLYEVSTKAAPKRIYKTRFPIETQASIISFRMPLDAPELKVGKFYRWEFAWNNPANSTCVGVVRRVDLDRTVLQQIAKAKPIDKASLYAKAGVWFEAVETLAEARRDRPDAPDLMTEWSDLLKSVGLDVVVLQPISPESLSTKASNSY
ncbi:DUF928 domain-containing protein [Pseudanabaena sp. PCC 6802]|uniref:DUF928 domain-containing protein n=1 Tax=Pseudanabaena sp. PCC 6802 TaxID=118173 RepID=UPI0003471652|nr:DUF928 domain-containing protein [Pseudanabaena sp. PCC 6802]